MREERERNIDEELADLFEEAAENAYMSIVMQHSEEDFYICMFHFDQKLHARVSAFSTQALERAFQEQEITDEREKRWYRIGGVAALCEAYGYTERLSELDAVLDRRAAEMYGDPKELLGKLSKCIGTFEVSGEELIDIAACEREFLIRVDSAAEAVRRLRERGLFGEYSKQINCRVGPEGLDSVLRLFYQNNRDDVPFLVWMLCDSDSRSPLMPDWFQ